MVKPNEPKRKSETQPQANAKKQKTKDIRKKQNGVASSIGADQITFGRPEDKENVFEYDENDNDNEDDDEDDSTDEEENLTLQQQMWAKMAHGLDSLSTMMGQYFSHSTQNTNATNNLLKTLVQKDEANLHLPRYSSSHSSRSSSNTLPFSRIDSNSEKYAFFVLSKLWLLLKSGKLIFQVG